MFEEVRVAKVRGTDLAYVSRGEGNPIVFVHGGISDLRTWESQIPFFATSFNAISFSRRYHKPNAPIEMNATDPWTEHVEDLAEFLATVGVAPAHIAGNSQGAFIALLLAIKYPDLVRTLILEEPPLLSLYVGNPPTAGELASLLISHPRTAIEIILFGALTITRAKNAILKGDDELAARIFTAGVLRNRTFDDLPQTRQAQILDNFEPLKAFIIGEGLPDISAEGIKGVTLPVLLLVGEHSPGVLVCLTDRLEELLPNRERVTISNASHLMHEEAPDSVNRAVLEFIGRH